MNDSSSSSLILDLGASRVAATTPVKGGFVNERRKFISAVWKPEYRRERWLQRGEFWSNKAGMSFWLNCGEVLSQQNNAEDKWRETIEKDIARTGVHKIFLQPRGQLPLRRILWAFCRQCPVTGYCQSLSLIAAVLLLHLSFNEDSALSLLVCISEAILPEYFSDGMRGLVGDLDAFHIIMSDKLPKLYDHLHSLGVEDDGPPVINANVSGWLSSMFIHLLPTSRLTKLWDSLFEDGSEMLLRYVLAIFSLMEPDLLRCKTAVQFYSTMSALAKLIDDQDNPLFPGEIILMRAYSFGPLPMPGLEHLRATRRLATTHSISDLGLQFQLPEVEPFENVGALNLNNQVDDSEDWDDLSFVKNFVDRRGDHVNNTPELYNPPGSDCDPWELVDSVEATEDEQEFDNASFTNRETAYHWLVSETGMSNPDAEPRIRFLCGEIQANILEKCVSRYKRWEMETAPSAEQNRLLLEIMRSERQQAIDQSIQPPTLSAPRNEISQHSTIANGSQLSNRIRSRSISPTLGPIAKALVAAFTKR